MVEAFLVSAASLGACFANLQRIDTFISVGTYDPRFQSTYWTRWVMGVISGVILSQLVYNSLLAHSGVGPSPSGRDRATDPRAGRRLFRRFRPRPSQARNQYRRQFLWCFDRRSGRQSAGPRDRGGSGAGETG